MNRTLSAVMVVLLGGCVHHTVSPKEKPPPEPSFDLESSESALAQALALFAHGLVLNAASGTNSRQRARADFDAALELAPGAAPVRKALLADLVKDRPGEALELLERLRERNPEDAEILEELAVLRERLQKYSRAAEAYRRLESLSPNPSAERRAALRAARIRCLFHAGEDAQARALLRKATGDAEEVSFSPGPALGWARYFASKHQFERALPCLEIARTGLSGNPAAETALLEFKGVLLERLHPPGRAAAVYREVLRRDPSRISSARRLAQLEISPEPEAALAALEETIEKTPADPIPRGAAAVLLLEQGNPESALRHLRRLHDILKETQKPPSAEFLALLSNLLIETGHPDAAIPVLEEGVTLHPEAHLLANNLAYLWSERGTRLEEARNMARKALAQAPGNGAYLDTLAWIEYRLGYPEKALRGLMRALKRLPDDPTVLAHTGDVLHALGRTPEAISFWLRGLAVDPGNDALIEKLRAEGVDASLHRGISGEAENTGDSPPPPLRSE